MSHHLGHPSNRPPRVKTVMVITREIKADLFDLQATAVRITISSSPYPDTVTRAIENRMGIPFGEMQVTYHNPNNFLARFRTTAFRNQAVAKGSFRFAGEECALLPYQEDVHSDLHFPGAFRYRVRLLLEGLPLHAWRAESVNKLLASCDRFDPTKDETRLHMDTSISRIWAWTHDPNAIPVESAFTLVDPPKIVGGKIQSDYGFRPRLPCVPTTLPPKTTKSRVLIHLDTIEDYTSMTARLHGGDPVVDHLAWAPRVVDS